MPSWAVYNGERSHAVTLHWLDAGIDSGPIAWEQSFKAATTGLPANGPPGSVREITESGVTVTTGDELILVQRIWKNSRYLRPGELLGD